jgi:hypothetical protein
MTDGTSDLLGDLLDYAPQRAESPNDLARDLEIIVYGKDFRYRQMLANPEYAFFTPTWASNGYGAFAVSPSHDVNEFLQENGARVRVIYRGKFLMSGMVRSMRGSFLQDEQIVYQVSDDRRILTNTVAWIDPANPLIPSRFDELAQATGRVNQPGALSGQYGYYLYGGDSVRSAEAMIKRVCEDNIVKRLGRPVQVAENQDRGGDVRAAGKVPLIRFDTVEEAVEPLALTVESGAIIEGYWDRMAPASTRWLEGGPGGGAIRAWRERRNLEQEAEYGDIAELTRDSTSAEMIWPEEGWSEDYKSPKYFHLYRGDPRFLPWVFDHFENGMNAKADIDERAGSATAGLTLTLAEAGAFRFGGDTGFQVGDIITAVSGDLLFRDQITECIVGQNMEKGSYATPKVGGTVDDPEMKTRKAIANLARQARRADIQR